MSPALRGNYDVRSHCLLLQKLITIFWVNGIWADFNCCLFSFFYSILMRITFNIWHIMFISIFPIMLHEKKRIFRCFHFIILYCIWIISKSKQTSALAYNDILSITDTIQTQTSGKSKPIHILIVLMLYIFLILLYPLQLIISLIEKI